MNWFEDDTLAANTRYYSKVLKLHHHPRLAVHNEWDASLSATLVLQSSNDPLAERDLGGASVQATQTLTLTGNALDTETVVINGKTYTFQDSLTNVDGNVKIGASAAASITNLIAAITLGAGSGTAYAAATTLHSTFTAAEAAGDTMLITAKVSALPGTLGNGKGTTETLTNGSWGAATTSGGTDAEGSASWYDETDVDFDDPAGSAAGEEVYHIANAVARAYRLRVTTGLTAGGVFSSWPYSKEG